MLLHNCYADFGLGWDEKCYFTKMEYNLLIQVSTQKTLTTLPKSGRCGKLHRMALFYELLQSPTKTVM